ncbi:MAG: DUF4367 domain-containing protein [Firmicutes bacterium]|nr:DUF4367 domain-containing protein [Dethiobacter sp.]MBS3889478.1 DUF4367 domain-containing protein [Bacillota bacterium]
MPSNQAKFREEYEDALFKMLLHDVAEHEGKAILQQMQTMGDSPDSKPSELLLKKFGKQLDIELRKLRQAERKQVAIATVRGLAICLLALLTVFFTAMATVSAFRTRVMNIWMDIRPEYTAFQLRGSESSEGGGMVVNWSNTYVPTYLPEGYEVNSFSFNEGLKRIVFENASTQTFILYTELDEASSMVLDTENADRFEEISMNDQSGTLVVKNNLVTIVWKQEGRLFMIKTQTDIGTAIKVAEGVKFIK